MKTVIAAVLLVSGAVFAQENDKPVLVISPLAGVSSGATTAGAEVGLYAGSGRFTSGVSAIVTAGQSSWAGGLLDARWEVLEAAFTPYLGAGLGVFHAQRGSLDLGVQPTAAVEAGVTYARFFAGARVLVPLSQHVSGPQAHDVGGLGDPALLAQLGFRL